ncbi:Crp/Fnr family transcriptional regulator [Runella sp.]|uniref:Crp/Fnr family transcriptional regulator n=1 Tax=Runella sp. TaxID=1960881 RepID=UPI003D139AEE
MTGLKQYLYSLSPIKEETWLKVQPLFREASLKKGEYFIEEGQFATEFAFLKKGVIRAFYRSRSGMEYIKYFFTPCSIVGGYTSLITGQPNQIMQQALTDCELLVANYGAFTGLYDSCPDLERLGRRYAENYFVEKERKELEIILHEAEERYLIFQKQYPQLEQQIPQYYIAAYLGISPTQLSRVRKKIARP